MEADFNAINKIIYGRRMLQNVRRHGCMQDEIFSEKNQMADNGTMAKVLFFDISRQSRRSAGISLVDADNCFDWVAHAVASLIFQAFGVTEETSAAMLKTIQEMHFFCGQPLETPNQRRASASKSKHKDYARAMVLHWRDGQW